MVDTTKKSNRKCEHCEHWNKTTSACARSGKIKNYWNCCKMFAWRADLLTPDAQLQLEQQRIKAEENKLNRMKAEMAKLEKQLKDQQELCLQQELKVVKMKHDFATKGSK